MGTRRWTEEEKKALKELLNRKNAKFEDVIRVIPSRTIQSLERKAQQLGSLALFHEKQNECLKAAVNHNQLIRYDKFTEELLKRLKRTKTCISLPAVRKKKGFQLTEDAGLLLSDIHFGKKNFFWNPETEKNEMTYSIDIFKKEMNRLLDAMTSINDLLLGGYRLEHLHIFGLGDLVDNEFIYKGQNRYVEEGVLQQVADLIAYLRDMLIELSRIYPRITFIIIGGNHGRIKSIREAFRACDNFDWLVGKMLQMLFEGNERINIIVPDSWYYVHKVYDWKYLLHHGDTVYSWMSLPYYGIVRQSKARRIEIPYDLECIGHFHQLMEITTSSKSKTVVNGSWVNDDEFAWRKFGVFSKSEQLYFGISPKRAQTWRFPLDLDIRKWSGYSIEEKGHDEKEKL